MAKNTLVTMIENVANNKLNGKFNLPQYKKEGTAHNAEYKKALLHKSICEQVLKFAAEHKELPLYFILQVGISKGAFKVTEFEKGYKSFNAEKVLKVAEFGKLYNEHNGIGGRKMSDTTIRLVMRYVEKVSDNLDDFKESLAKSAVLGKKCGERGDYDGLCRNLGIPTVNRHEKETAVEETEAVETESKGIETEAA